MLRQVNDIKLVDEKVKSTHGYSVKLLDDMASHQAAKITIMSLMDIVT